MVAASSDNLDVLDRGLTPHNDSRTKTAEQAKEYASRAVVGMSAGVWNPGEKQN